jgi:hypothetical protein
LLFASMMSVSPGPGIVTTREDEPFSAAPNCQTIV